LSPLIIKPIYHTKDPLLQSAISAVGIHSNLEILEWVEKNLKQNKYAVNLTPLTQLRGWKFSGGLQSFGHESGRFFQIQGLKILLDRGGEVTSWEQPIINQPEVGILVL
jgi:oxidase EvaA